MAARTLLCFVRAYQYVFSPHFGTQCRFTPTCSHYAVDALTKYGALKGSYLTSRRLLRCHPWCPGGYDPIP
ncbi:MAG: membrane protein insertion efficiency factor YidD [Burkholderiales bacterium]|nr:membrane protein insertion efficiency factor YidD [Burkholderiales bacterium]